MAGAKRFEDLVVWQEARKLVKSIYLITSNGAISRDYGLRDQIQRAAVSAMTNIAEGFDCESKAEFARFLSYSRRSAVEVQSLLYAAQDIGYISSDVFSQHFAHAEKVKAMSSALKSSLLRASTARS